MIVSWSGAGARHALYHVTSRVVDRQVLFGERERARFLKLAKALARFSGFELVSWCLMGNHFHLLVRVPPQEVAEMTQDEVLARARHILSDQRRARLEENLAWCRDDVEQREQLLATFRRRIGSLPMFMKALKQEFTQWYNLAHDRAGTMWESRYYSVVVEDSGQDDQGRDRALETGLGEVARIVAGYIDLNPMRAGVEKEPGALGWNSMGAATRGDPEARAGLLKLWGRQNASRAGDDKDGTVMSALENRAMVRHLAWLKREWARTVVKDKPGDIGAAADRISGLDFNLCDRSERMSRARSLSRRDFARTKVPTGETPFTNAREHEDYPPGKSAREKTRTSTGRPT